MQADARAEYPERLASRQAAAAALAAEERSIGTWRLILFIVGLVLAWLAFGLGHIATFWVGLPVVGFAVLMQRHGKVIAARQRVDRAVAYYERGTARIEDRWPAGGETGARFVDAAHPYSGDLDVFGPRSLFALLCTARTRAGEDTLADWLKVAAPIEESRARQEAIDDLRPRFDLREALAVLGDEVGTSLQVDVLAAWARSTTDSVTVWRIVAAAAVVASATAALALQLGAAGPVPLVVALAVQSAIGLTLRSRVRATMRAVEAPARHLTLLAALLERIEAETFTAPKLVRLRAALEGTGAPPSRRIAQLGRLVNLLDARRNQFFAPLAPLLLWSTQCALAIDAWRGVSGAAVAGWLSAVGEFEALCSMATYAAEHADDPFPELVEDGPVFDAEGLGHPLLPLARCVRNDLSLGRECAALVVSGSNMSGKSTLLRSVGLNAVLAQMGAPVRARRLRLSPLAVGTSMRVQDSLQDGTSRFYAEITRLRSLVDLSRPPSGSGRHRPLLFLLDEILHGTNSHDRKLGAEAVVRGLVAHQGIGLVTTHDLSLAHIAEALAPRAANVHFEDHLENGRMVFDYTMRPGVVRKSNALELMRAVGLEV